MRHSEKPIADPLVVLREEFDDWAILFHVDTCHGFGLNPTGVYLWKLLDGEHTIDALLEEIRAYAEGVPEEAKDHRERRAERGQKGAQAGPRTRPEQGLG